MIASDPHNTAIHTSALAEHSRGPLADAAVIDGAKAMALTAIDFWTSEQMRTSVQADFARANPDKDVL